jgi:hypothetical protein
MLKEKKIPKKEEVEKALHLTHFINVISKYLNLFDDKNNFSDEKFDYLQSLFVEHRLELKMFEAKKQ